MVSDESGKRKKGKARRLRAVPTSNGSGSDQSGAGSSNGTQGASGKHGGAKVQEPQHRGQFNLATRFVAEHGQEFRYCKALGWLTWDGSRWSSDADGAPSRAVQATLKKALRDAIEMPLGSDEQKLLIKDVRSCESASAVNGVLTLASVRHPVAVSIDKLDADPYLFNLAGGSTIDLRTGKVRPAAREDLITKVAGCGLPGEDELRDGSGSPVFDKFFQQVVPDEEVREFIWRLFGMAMLGVVREHVFPLLYGIGSNGKTTLVDLIKEIFGDYAITIDSEIVMARASSLHPTGIADLRGVRLAVTSETDEGRKLNAGLVKRLTGADDIRARYMGKDFFEFKPSHTLIMYTNHRPEISADDYAMWRRVKEIDFSVVISDKEKDTALPDKLRLEMSAVLAKLLAGYEDYASMGLAAPSAVESATASYREDADVLARFRSECLRDDPEGRVFAGDLYESYKEWCAGQDIQHMAHNLLSQRLALRSDFGVKKTSKGKTYYRGIARRVE